MLTFRHAQEADLDRLIDIHRSAFPDPRDHAERRRNFVSNRLGDLADLVVAHEGDLAVAHAFLFSARAWFGGAQVPVGAIASVGVSPEARGRGVASALLAHLHELARARGDAVTLLYPYRQGFYARLGYAPVTPMRRIELSPRAIPAAWNHANDIAVRAATGGDRDAVVRADERFGARATGIVVRSARVWDRVLADERRTFFVAEGCAAGARGVCGYLSWSLEQHEEHAESRMIVRDLAADDDITRHALLAHVRRQADQVARVFLDVDACDPIDRALTDADQHRFGTADMEHAIGVVSAGPMVRIANLDAALTSRGFLHDGELHLAIDGAKSVRFVVEHGRASIHAAAGNHALEVDTRTLSALLYGALTPSDAARIGWLAAPDEATLHAADALFTLPPFFSRDPF